MNSILNQIINTVYNFRSKDELRLDLVKVYQSIANNFSQNEVLKIKEDFNYFSEKGCYVVHNTFSGGIIFLREPEVIKIAKIEFYSDHSPAQATVEYASNERNARNVKYKKSVGNIESIKWHMQSIFPNFNEHQHEVKLILIAIIGTIVKQICETCNKVSWFMEFEKDFDFELYLDKKLELKFLIQVQK